MTKRTSAWLSLALAVLVTAALAILVGCGPTEYAAVGEPRAAGADATIEIDEVEGGNMMVTVEAMHLPPPGRIAEGATTYVVWFVSSGGGATKAGSLAYEADDRTGSLVATYTEETFRVIITAEPSRAAARPSEHVVLDREVSY